jgi:hypothetical protein
MSLQQHIAPKGPLGTHRYGYEMEVCALLGGAAGKNGVVIHPSHTLPGHTAQTRTSV